MALLHAMERGAPLPRVSTDLDVLVNPRVLSGGVGAFVKSIELRGFTLVGVSPEGIAHRYRREDVSIDVLAPEGLGRRTNTSTTGTGRTVQVPGGSQALSRTELLPVEFGDRRGFVPRPNLLGAIICKASAVGVDDVPANQRTDLGLLLSLVDDPVAMSGQLSKSDRRRLRQRAEMADPHETAWSRLDARAAERGRAAYRLLCQ